MSTREWDEHALPSGQGARPSCMPGLENAEKMDVDDPEDQSVGLRGHFESRQLSTPPSLHSEDLTGQLTGDHPPSSSGLSGSVSLSDNHSTSPSDVLVIEKGADDPSFHAAYRLFK